MWQNSPFGPQQGSSCAGANCINNSTSVPPNAAHWEDNLLPDSDLPLVDMREGWCKPDGVFERILHTTNDDLLSYSYLGAKNGDLRVKDVRVSKHPQAEMSMYGALVRSSGTSK